MASSRVQLRQPDTGPPETVNIELVGPQSILQGKKVHITNAPLDAMWLHLLNSRGVNLKIPKGSGLYICSNQTPGILEHGEYWSSELDESVRDYIQKCSWIKQDVYPVKLCYGSASATNIKIIDISGSDIKVETTHEQIKMEQNESSEMPAVAEDALSATANSNDVIVGIDNSEPLMPTTNWGDYNHDIDQDLKTIVRNRLKRFSNKFLLRVREEISDRKKKHLREEYYVIRCPLGSQFLLELFKD